VLNAWLEQDQTHVGLGEQFKSLVEWHPAVKFDTFMKAKCAGLGKKRLFGAVMKFADNMNDAILVTHLRQGVQQLRPTPRLAYQAQMDKRGRAGVRLAFAVPLAC